VLHVRLLAGRHPTSGMPSPVGRRGAADLDIRAIAGGQRRPRRGRTRKYTIMPSVGRSGSTAQETTVNVPKPSTIDVTRTPTHAAVSRIVSASSGRVSTTSCPAADEPTVRG